MRHFTFFTILGEGKDSPSLGDQISANGGIVMAEFPSDVSFILYFTY